MNYIEFINMPDKQFAQIAPYLDDKSFLEILKLRENYKLSQMSDLEIAERIFRTFEEIERKYPEMIDDSENENKTENVLV